MFNKNLKDSRSACVRVYTFAQLKINLDYKA